jgi:hypothetical protein
MVFLKGVVNSISVYPISFPKFSLSDKGVKG